MSFLQRILGKKPTAPKADFAKYPQLESQPRFLETTDHNQALCEDGFVAFPWLGDAEIEKLKQIVDEAGQGLDFDDVHIPTAFHLSSFHNDARYKSKIYKAVSEALFDRLNDLLPDYEPLVINYFNKEPQDSYDAVPIHQNPSFVDEPAHKSVSLWIPLQDVGKDNGGIGVQKGSHNRINTMRSGNMPHSFVFSHVSQVLEQELFEPIEMKKGEVLVLDDSIIHWSFPNVSTVSRQAVQLIMVPRKAKHIYYYYDDSQAEPMMDLYEVNKDFFFNFNCNDRPQDLRLLDRVPYEYRPIERCELDWPDSVS